MSLRDELFQVIETPFEIINASIGVGASIGIALYPEDGKDAKQLIARADALMYELKYGKKHSDRPTP